MHRISNAVGIVAELEEEAGQETTRPATERRIAFERLRERTDELELIISGISLVALVALPSWLFAQWARLEVHAEGVYNAIVSIGFPLAIGLTYTLAGVFLLHLATRAYWVGLIGLKATFPHGIRWDRVDSFGPITRENYRRSIIDFDASIDATDRFASVIFAVVSLVTLSMLWGGTVLAGIAALSLVVGHFADISDRTAILLLTALMLLILVVTTLIPVLDRGSAWLRGPDKPPSAFMHRIVNALNMMQAFVLPQRLLLPVQLMLESNLPRRTFSIAFSILLVLTSLIGVVQLSVAKRFAPFIGGYEFMDDTVAAAGLRTAYYENLRADEDALLRLPMIPSDLMADAYLRVFLPYVPDRDNELLKTRCVPGMEHRICLASLWTLSLDGRVIDPATFEPAQRSDLGMRGLQGYVPMAGLAPGRHILHVTWNAEGSERKSRKMREYAIPFWFSPPYQSDLEPVEAPALEPAQEAPPSVQAEVPVTGDIEAK